jgi:hypothetical protein
LIELQSALIHGNVGRCGIQITEIGSATGGVHDEIGCHTLQLSTHRGVDHNTGSGLVDALNRCARAHIKAQFAKLIH